MFVVGTERDHHGTHGLAHGQRSTREPSGSTRALRGPRSSPCSLW